MVGWCHPFDSAHQISCHLAKARATMDVNGVFDKFIQAEILGDDRSDQDLYLFLKTSAELRLLWLHYVLWDLTTYIFSYRGLGCNPQTYVLIKHFGVSHLNYRFMICISMEKPGVASVWNPRSLAVIPFQMG